MGRDEEYLENQMWLIGVSQAILWGVGNGMLAWVCLKLRIPIVLVFDNELHKEVINAFLLKKLEEAMNDPNNQRFYKSDVILGVETEDSSAVAVAKAKAKAAVAKAAAAKVAAAKAKAAAKGAAAALVESGSESEESQEGDEA